MSKNCRKLAMYNRSKNISNIKKQVYLNVSKGGAGPFPFCTTLLCNPLNLVSTSINTHGKLKTNNLLIFSSIINLPLGAFVSIEFEIIRTKSGGFPIKIGPTYTFSTLAEILKSESFTFQFLDMNVVTGNYTYCVQITTNSFIDITPGVCILNATLSALTVEN